MLYNDKLMNKISTGKPASPRPPAFLKRILGEGQFMSDVIKIVGGTSLAQLLIALGTPVLSRLYSESTFGVASLFISMSLILSVIASLRYENAILLPKDEMDAVHLLRISLAAVAATTLLTAWGVWAAQDLILDLLNEPALAAHLPLLPLAMASTGLYQALNLWNTRTLNYWRLSAARVISAVITLALQIGLYAWLQDHPAGLILGFIGGYLAGSLFLGGYIYLHDASLRLAWDWQAVRANLHQYRKFPLVDTWGSLVNAVSWQIPPLLLTSYFSSALAGHYAMAYRLIQLPVSFIGIAVGQVYAQRAAAVKEDAQALVQVTRSVVHRLIGLGVFPALLLTVLGKDLLLVFLGPNWGTAGIYVQILGIWMFFWFASWPLGTLANIQNKQDILLILQVILLVSRVASLAIGGWLGNDLLAISLFAGTGIVLYAAYALLCLRMIDYPLHSSLPFLRDESLRAAGAVSSLALIRWLLPIPSWGMVLLGGLAAGLYFLLVMRKNLI
jgi:O-antigen/teichoic acid export membrane protein